MKTRYFLKQNNKPIEERLKKELVYAECSDKFGTNIDGVKKYEKFQISLDAYVTPQHFGILKSKRGSSNFYYDPTTIEKNKIHTSDLKQAIIDFDQHINTTKQFFRNSRPTKEEFKKRLELVSNIKGKSVAETLSVGSFIRKRIEFFKSIIGTGHPEAIKENSIANFQSLLAVIENYAEVKKTVTFENLKELYTDIWDIQDEIVRGKIILKTKKGYKKPVNQYGIATSTISLYQNCLRQICETAINEGISVSLSVTNKKLIHKTQKSSKQYAINNEDLLKIYQHTPSSERLQKAKDYIMFSSLVGMRLQSVLQLVGNPIETYDRKGIKFDYVYTIQEKTGTECHTPLFKIAKEIIIRNGNKLPNFSKYSGTINDQIKDLYIEAGLTYNITIVQHYYKAGKVVTNESVADIVSSHSTRKAFGTNLYKYGVDTSITKKVTHPERKENGTADSYNKITNETRALKFYKAVVENLEDNELYRF